MLAWTASTGSSGLTPSSQTTSHPTLRSASAQFRYAHRWPPPSGYPIVSIETHTVGAILGDTFLPALQPAGAEHARQRPVGIEPRFGQATSRALMARVVGVDPRDALQRLV